MSLIIDTDLGFDCDDAAAIAIANIYAKAKKAEILAVTHCVGALEGGQCIKMINDYYGNDIDIGISSCCSIDLISFYEKYYMNLRYSPAFEGFKEKPSFYRNIRPIVSECNISGIKFYDSVELIKQKLYHAADKSVTIVCIGQQNNIGALINEEYSGFGSFSNIGLLKEKLDKLVVMGGNFSDYRDYYEYGGICWHSEFNIYLDIPSARKVSSRPDLPLYYIDFNQGKNIFTGNGLIRQEDNPVKKIYQNFGGFSRPSWDLIAMLYALEGEGNLFGVSNQGRVVIDGSGRTTFENSGGYHRLISVKADSMDISLILNHLLASKEPLGKTHCA